MINYRLHLLRTGKTSDGPWKRYAGQSNIPLCQKGMDDLEEMKARFAYPKADTVYVSPLARCVQTAEILYPDTWTQEHDGLMDMNLGEFEGKTFEELNGDAAFSAWLENSFDNTPPGGEETIAFTGRIINAVRDIFTDMMEQRITDAAIITHGGVIMTLLAAVGLPKMPLHRWAVDNGCGYTLLMTPQMWMRSQAVEVFAQIPAPRTETDPDDPDENGM